jgi:hypothetical protein
VYLSSVPYINTLKFNLGHNCALFMVSYQVLFHYLAYYIYSLLLFDFVSNFAVWWLKDTWFLLIWIMSGSINYKLFFWWFYKQFLFLFYKHRTQILVECIFLLSVWWFKGTHCLHLMGQHPSAFLKGKTDFPEKWALMF